MKTISAIRNMKSGHVQDYINNLSHSIVYFSQINNTIKAVEELNKAYYSIAPASDKQLAVCAEALRSFYQNSFIPTLKSSGHKNIIEKADDYIPLTPQGIILQCEFLANVISPEDERVPLSELNEYKKSYSKYASLFQDFLTENNFQDLLIINPDGIVIYSSAKNPDFAADVKSGPLSFTTLKNIHLYSRNQPNAGVSRMFDFTFYPMVLMKPAAFIASPVANDNGYLGAIVGLIDSASFDTVINGNREWADDGLGKTGESYIVGSDLTMRTNSRMMVENGDAFMDQLKSIQTSSQNIDMIETNQSTVLLQQITRSSIAGIFAGKTTVHRAKNYLDTDAITAYAPLRIPDLDWGIVTEITVKEASDDIQAVKTDVLKSVAIVFVLVFILAIFASAAIVRPISTLGTAVIRFANGDYSRRINDRSRDEIGALSRTFDQMANTISERSQALLKVNNSLASEIKERVQTENILQILAANAQDAIIVSDENDDVSSWNESAEKMFGYKQEEILKAPIIPTLIPVKYEDYFIRSADRISSGVLNNEDTRIGYTFEIEAIRKTGELFLVEISMSLVKVRGVWNTFYVVRDISVRKQREEELKQALGKARIAEKTKTEFLANMSHEIRTPLNGILGFLDLLSQSQLTAVQEEYLKIINSSADSLLSIINEILDFSKIESGMMSLETLEVNIFTELEQIADLYAAKANEKDIDLLLDIDVDIHPYLICDPLRIRQILSNLLSNAIKFTHNGGVVTLSAKLLKKGEHSCSIRLMIKDTGIGIGKEMQKTIFTAFSQADSSVTRKYGGTGLGLAISARLARLMGTNITLESEPNEGSSFWVDLQLDRGKTENLPLYSSVNVTLFTAGETLSEHERILVRYLGALGCGVNLVSSFDDLTALKKFDIIFADCNSANEGQIEALQGEGTGTAQIVAVCGTKQTALKGNDQSRVRTIFKPINISKLADVIDGITNVGKQAREELASSGYSFSGRIIVAEDNKINQQLVQIMLSKLGIRVLLAENGEEALKLSASGEFDLILMDIHMPVMDGITATQKMLEREKDRGLPHKPIVALTANVIAEERKRYAAAGMDDFLAKPIVYDDLLDVLKKYLHYDKTENNVSNLALQRLADSMGIDDTNFMRSILSEFVVHTKEQIKTINGLIRNNRFNEVHPHIISIKGATANLQIKEIPTLLEKITAACKSDKDNCAYYTNKLQIEIEKLEMLYGLH